MAVSGLPVAVHRDLTDLLEEQALASWKVVGDINDTVVVFSTSGPVAITTSQPGRLQVPFRQKPPKRVRRDRKRVEEEQKARADQASFLDPSDCSMPLFMPIPPAKRNEIDSRLTGRQLADSTHVECET